MYKDRIVKILLYLKNVLQCSRLWSLFIVLTTTFCSIKMYCICSVPAAPGQLRRTIGMTQRVHSMQSTDLKSVRSILLIRIYCIEVEIFFIVGS